MIKLDKFQMIATSVAALGGLALAVYQTTVPKTAMPPETVQQATTNSGDAATAPVAAAVTAQVTDAAQLIGNMRSSIAVVAASYAESVKQPGAHRSGGLVLQSSKDTASALGELDTAIKKKDSRKIAASSEELTRSIGKLQTNYALAAIKPTGANAGMRTLNSSWDAYAARYMVKTDRKIARNEQEVKKLKKRVSNLEARVAKLEKRTRKNETLNREVIRVQQRLEHQRNWQDDDEDYAGLLITLALIDGVFRAFDDSTEFYYPDYHEDFTYVPDEYDLADAYWEGYYDGYYDAQDEGWYAEAYYVPETLDIRPDPVVIQYQNVNVTQIINITTEAAPAYDALPPEDLTNVKIEAVPAETMSQPEVIETLARAAPVEPPPAMPAEAQAEAPADQTQKSDAASQATEQPAAEAQPEKSDVAPAPEAEQQPAQQQEQPAPAEAAAPPETKIEEATQPEPQPAPAAEPAQQPEQPAPAETVAQPEPQPAPEAEPAQPEQPAAAETTAQPEPQPAPEAQPPEAVPEAAPAETPPAAPEAAPVEPPPVPGEEPAAVEPPPGENAAPAPQCGGEGNPCPEQQ